MTRVLHIIVLIYEYYIHYISTTASLAYRWFTMANYKYTVILMFYIYIYIIYEMCSYNIFVMYSRMSLRTIFYQRNIFSDFISWQQSSNTSITFSNSETLKNKKNKLWGKILNKEEITILPNELNPLPPAITSGGNFVRAMLNCCFPATAA